MLPDQAEHTTGTLADPAIVTQGVRGFAENLAQACPKSMTFSPAEWGKRKIRVSGIKDMLKKNTKSITTMEA